MRILIVDDLSCICDLFASLCRRWGHEAYTCIHGPEVLEMVERIRPDVLLLDIAMPTMDGLAIADALKNSPELRPKTVVAVTGYGDEMMRKKIAVAGFDHHLVKPVGVKELTAILHPQVVEKDNALPLG